MPVNPRLEAARTALRETAEAAHDHGVLDDSLYARLTDGTVSVQDWADTLSLRNKNYTEFIDSQVEGSSEATRGGELAQALFLAANTVRDEQGMAPTAILTVKELLKAERDTPAPVRKMRVDEARTAVAEAAAAARDGGVIDDALYSRLTDGVISVKDWADALSARNLNHASYIDSIAEGDETLPGALANKLFLAVNAQRDAQGMVVTAAVTVKEILKEKLSPRS